MDDLKRFYHHIISDTARSYQALQVFRLGSVLLLSVVLVKANIATESIGDFEWFIFLSNVASFFWGLGLKNAFMSYFPKLENKLNDSFIASLIVLFLILGSIAFFILLCFQYPRLDSLYTYLPYLFCFLVFGTAASLSEHILIVKQQSKRLFYYGFISYTLYFVGLSLLAFFFQSIQPLFIGLAIWAILRFIYLMSLVNFSNSSLDFGLIKKFVIFGLPLIFHVLLGGGMEFVDGFLVDNYFTRSDFTLFRYGARELPINTIFISALASAFIPLAVLNLNESLEKIKARTSRLMNYLFPVSIVLMLISPYIFAHVYSNEFVISAHIFNIYLLILCSRILLPQIVLYAKHKNNVLMVVSFIEFTINVGLSLLLMKTYGLYGIAFATVVAFLIQKLILIFYSWNTLKVPVSSYLDLPKYLLYTVALYGTFILSTFFYL